MKRPVLSIAAVALAAMVPLSGCATGDTSPAAGATSTAPAAGFPVTVGGLTLTAPPAAIVSLSPTATEMLFAIGAGDLVVAVDEFSTYPPGAPVTDLSGFTPNVEAIASYGPDLVVVSYDPGNLISQLTTLEIPVHVVPDTPTSLDDIYAQLTDLGTLTGQGAGAADLVAEMAAEIERLVAGAPVYVMPLRYYIEIDNTLWTYTSESLLGALFAMVGLENIATSGNPGEVTMQLSPEAVVTADPQVILLANAQFGESAATVADRPGWSGIEAVRTGTIVELSPDIASRWGPRVVDLLREVVDAVSQVG
jgi:iron complex transport system substrate-binding protein